MKAPSIAESASKEQQSRLQGIHDRIKSSTSSPTARLINEAYQRWSPAVTPSSLYSQQSRAHSPSIGDSRRDGSSVTTLTDLAGHTSKHFKTQQSTPTKSARLMTPKTRSPFLAIRTPSVRPGTGGSLDSTRARTPLVGTVSSKATKEEMLDLHRQEIEHREKSMQRHEVSRFHGHLLH